jgi:hypothetical protein
MRRMKNKIAIVTDEKDLSMGNTEDRISELGYQSVRMVFPQYSEGQSSEESKTLHEVNPTERSIKEHKLINELIPEKEKQTEELMVDPSELKKMPPKVKKEIADLAKEEESVKILERSPENQTEVIAAKYNVVCIDFDNTIANTSKGKWTIKDGAIDALKDIKDKGYKILIFTARNSVGDWTKNRAMVENFLKSHDIVFDEIVDGKDGKPNADFYIDDKAIKFNNNWKDIVKEVKAMRMAYVIADMI